MESAKYAYFMPIRLESTLDASQTPDSPLVSTSRRLTVPLGYSGGPHGRPIEDCPSRRLAFTADNGTRFDPAQAMNGPPRRGGLGIVPDGKSN